MIDANRREEMFEEVRRLNRRLYRETRSPRPLNPITKKRRLPWSEEIKHLYWRLKEALKSFVGPGALLHNDR